MVKSLEMAIDSISRAVSSRGEAEMFVKVAKSCFPRKWGMAFRIALRLRGV